MLILQVSEEKKMLTGLVATSTVTHATPASFAAHVDYRKKEAEIAYQYVHSGVDIILGGGKKFWPDSLINTFGEFFQPIWLKKFCSVFFESLSNSIRV